METTKLLAGEPTLEGYGSMHKCQWNMAQYIRCSLSRGTPRHIYHDDRIKGGVLRGIISIWTNKFRAARKRLKLRSNQPIPSHGATHQLAMDMGVGAYSRRSHSICYIRRLTFFKVILASCCGEMCKNLAKIRHFWPRFQPQTRCRHKTGGK